MFIFSSSIILESILITKKKVDIVDIYESIRERRRHDSERSTCSTLERNDIEAVETLVCMSSWGQRSQKGDLLKIRPLTPVSDSGDFVVQNEPTSEMSKDYNFLSTLCMTPPYSPDFVEPSTASLPSSQTTYSKPRAIKANVPASVVTPPGWTLTATQPSVLNMEKQSSQMPARTEQPVPPLCRAMATSVIRHTGNSSGYSRIPGVQVKPEVSSGYSGPADWQEAQGQQHSRASRDCNIAENLTCDTLLAHKSSSHVSGCSRTAYKGCEIPRPAVEQSLYPKNCEHDMQQKTSSLLPSPLSNPQVICQMIPLDGPRGMVSALLKPSAQTAGTIKSILPHTAPVSQPVLMGPSMPQGTVMFVLPQAAVAQAPPCQQTVMSVGNTKLLPLAPAPVFIASGQSSTPLIDFSGGGIMFVTFLAAGKHISKALTSKPICVLILEKNLSLAPGKVAIKSLPVLMSFLATAEPTQGRRSLPVQSVTAVLCVAIT
uniref:KLF transcription factor 11 n=1 Tax=Naja naja TaxID=35670 RepID=A0A8C6XQX5_NAJNA